MSMLSHATILFTLIAITSGGAEPKAGESPADHVPRHIRQLTSFGERADWSHDGKRILFLSKTFGDAMELDVATKTIRNLTAHYAHHGYTRALYLSNGHILLSGPDELDPGKPGKARVQCFLYVLDPNSNKPAISLGSKCSEGPAVSRKRLHIAWTHVSSQYPDEMPPDSSRMQEADIVFEDGKAKLANPRVVLDSRDLPFSCTLETQNFRPPEENELTFSAYRHQGTDVCGVNLTTRKVVNYSNAPGQYDEPEGIFPDGQFTLVECDKQNRKGASHVDLWKLKLDGSGAYERLTYFSDYPGYKASNPVVSDDGRLIAFQLAKSKDAAGVGHGIFIYDIQKAEEARTPPFPMPELKAPRFPDKTFSILDFGAVPDGKTKNTVAFAQAIAACNQAGGGRVVVPAGTWFTGPIIFRSNVDLHLEKGAVVSFSSDPVDYAPSVFTSLGRARPGLICNNEGQNIALTGEGEFQGNGQPWWKPVTEKKKLKLKRDPRVSTIPAEFSFIDPGTGKKVTIGRPTFVSFNNTTNLLIEGVTFRDGPIFMVHPNDCENVIIRNIRVLAAEGENTDGIDPAACRNVLIENCYLDTGDDCLVIKSREGRPAENIVIRNLTAKRGHGGVVIGSTIKGGVRNVFAYDCDFDGTDAGIRIKSNRDCGGPVENLWFEDIRMGTILKQAIIMDMWYNDKERTLPPNPRSTPAFHDIHIRNVTCEDADQAMVLVGLPESPIHDITLADVTIRARKGVTEEHTENITRANVKIQLAPSQPRER